MPTDPERRKFRFTLLELFTFTLVVAGYLAMALYTTHDLRSSYQKIRESREHTKNQQNP